MEIQNGTDLEYTMEINANTKWNSNCIHNSQFRRNGIQDGTEMEYTMEHQWNTQWNRHTTMSIN